MRYPQPLLSFPLLLLTFLIASACLATSAAAQPVPVPGAPEAQEASPTEALLDAARQAARENRNRESADLFARALAQAPQQRGELLPEYADQLTYSDRSREAVPLYQEVLAASPAPEVRLRAQRGLGLALLWSDQPTPAQAVYRAILREQPRDAAALRGLARALSWSGMHREAAQVLRFQLQEQPADAEARLMLAQSQAWMGRTDLARVTLNSAELADSADAERLRKGIDLGLAPRTRVDVQRSRQSDNLNIGSTRIAHEQIFDNGRAMAGLRLDRLQFEREDGSNDATVTRPTLRGRYRLSDAFEINGEVGSDRIALRGTPAFDRLVWATWLTFWLNDSLRLDASSSRSTFDNLQSLRMGLTTTQNGLSMDYTPDQRQKYSAKIERGIYSDGNRRWSGQVEGEYRWWHKPDAWIGLRHSRMAFSELLDNGYFNPKTFEATQLTARMTHRPGGDGSRLDFTVAAAYGREQANPDGSKPAYDVSLRAGWRIDPKTRLEARVQRFSSRTSNLSGFARTTAGVVVERGW